MAEVFLVDVLDEHLRNDGDVDQVCLWSNGSCSLRTVSKDDSWLYHEESEDYCWQLEEGRKDLPSNTKYN